MRFATRRLICRAAFLGLCLLPTSLVIGHIVSRSLPSYVAGCELRLARELGLGIDISAVTHPKPGITWVEGTRLFDPETKATLATVELAEINRPGNKFVVNLHQVRVNSRRIGHFFRAVHEALRRLPKSGGMPADLWATNLLLFDEDRETQLTLSNVSVGYEPSDDESQVSLSFHVEGGHMGSPVDWRFCRHHQADPPVTTFDLRTNGSRLPGSLLEFCLPTSQRMGPDFAVEAISGEARYVDGWYGKGSFRLVGVKLDRVVSDVFPHRLTGNADVTVGHIEIENGRVVACSGDVTVLGGQISRSLIEAAERSLYLRWKTRRRSDQVGELIRFNQLAFSFNFDDDDGFELRGRRDSSPPGVILLSDSGDLWEFGYQPLPIWCLVRMLVQTSNISSNHEMVPATRETDMLLRLLPIPPPAWRPPAGQN